MNAIETARAAREERAYQNSAQATKDRRADRDRRMACDRAVGHLPSCGLLKCNPARSRA